MLKNQIYINSLFNILILSWTKYDVKRRVDVPASFLYHALFNIEHILQTFLRVVHALTISNIGLSTSYSIRCISVIFTLLLQLSERQVSSTVKTGLLRVIYRPLTRASISAFHLFSHKKSTVIEDRTW